MILYSLRRFVLLIITLFFLSLVSFSLLYYTPNAPLSGASLLDAYRFYFNSVFHGDFGVSSTNGELITTQLKNVFPATLELYLFSFSFALFIGIPLGILGAFWHNKTLNNVISAFALFGFSIPVFVVALILTLFFSLKLGWLPVSGRIDLLYNLQPVTGFALIDAWLSPSPYRQMMIMNVLAHMVLPVIVLSLIPITEVMELTRESSNKIANTNYIKAAASRGLSRFTIIRRHVLHNIIPPIISKLGIQFSSMISLMMMTEIVFDWPGIGRWLVMAIRQQDYYAIAAGVMVIGAFVIIVNVLSDILGNMLDPLKHKDGYVIK